MVQSAESFPEFVRDLGVIWYKVRKVVPDFVVDFAVFSNIFGKNLPIL